MKKNIVENFNGRRHFSREHRLRLVKAEVKQLKKGPNQQEDKI